VIRVIEVPAAGANGAANGETRQWVSPGSLHAVDVDFASGQPATADVTITCAGRTVLTLANQNADRTIYPRVPVQDATGADVPGQFVEPLLPHGEVVVAVAQANAGNPAATARLYVRR
jgi:hypothetical protein